MGSRRSPTPAKFRERNEVEPVNMGTNRVQSSRAAPRELEWNREVSIVSMPTTAPRRNRRLMAQALAMIAVGFAKLSMIAVMLKRLTQTTR